MKKRDVQIGGRYTAKVSGRLTTVKILGESPSGGWRGWDEKTSREVHVKTAQRLRTLA